ncbi:MAG: N-acetylmuramoyl-L-alanine amidase [Lachnospiraceae bacterium]|nr:N-acetylmuramoyl-L-alanine amidase [Lachnospiraceae bacterium]
MNRRKYKKRKRIVIAYTLRTIVGIIILGMLFLMGCGCRYLYEKLTQVKSVEKYQAQMEQVLSLNVKNEEAEKIGTIVLDAGHGGADVGTSSGEILEKDINLDVVMRMKAFLEQKNIEVLLTRSDDDTLSLSERTEIANQSKADLYVSIHCNYFEENSSIKGLECYYYEESEEGKRIAENIINSVQQNKEIVVRNAKEENFYVLKQTRIPAVLVELGYLSNPTECKKMTSEGYQETLAMELANALESILIESLR